MAKADGFLRPMFVDRVVGRRPQPYLVERSEVPWCRWRLRRLRTEGLSGVAQSPSRAGRGLTHATEGLTDGTRISGGPAGASGRSRCPADPSSSG